MANPTSVSRCVERGIFFLQKNDYEGALINIFPAIDKTAKRRRSSLKVGERFIAFLDEEEVLLYSIVFNNKQNSKIISNNYSIAKAIYKFARCSIVHEGELDSRIEINTSNSIEIGNDKWNISHFIIVALLIIVIIAPENKNEFVEGDLNINILGQNFLLNQLWGGKQKILDILDSI